MAGLLKLAVIGVLIIGVVSFFSGGFIDVIQSLGDLVQNTIGTVSDQLHQDITCRDISFCAETQEVDQKAEGINAAFQQVLGLTSEN